MKLIRFTTAESTTPTFGTVVRDQAVSFAVLQNKVGKSSAFLADSRSYLSNLPDSEQVAKKLLSWAETHLEDLAKGERHPLDEVHLLEPVDVTALFDFAKVEGQILNFESFRTTYPLLARSLRIEFPGAVYHLTSRGNA